MPLDAAKSPTTAEDRSEIESGLRSDFQSGALGLGLIFFYFPVTAEEALGLFRIAADYKRPVFAHLRDNGVYESLQEVIANAVVSGAQLHIEHVNSFGINVPRVLRVIDDARLHGVDITTEALAYTSAGVPIESRLFAPGWQQRLHSDYSDLVWQDTGEHLTAESFDRYRKQGGRVISTVNTEETVRTALSHPQAIIASDGILDAGRGHPRSAGTFARVMGKYVREEKALSLMEAVRKCTLLPAQWLERSTPQMLRKGRIKVGADADIVVFDAGRIIDRATIDNPARYSEGVRYVLVDGVLVVREGQLRDGVAPGQGIRAR
jgi:dihydroorotase